jgi:thiol-disulfide isomerase/thioredoxin
MKSLKITVIFILFSFSVCGQAPTGKIPFTDWMDKSFPLQDWITLDGDTLSQSFFSGKVCFFNFYAAGCPPCMAEVSYLNKLSQHYIENEDVCVVSFFYGSEAAYHEFYKSQESQTKASQHSILKLKYSLVPVPKYPIIPIGFDQFKSKYHAWGIPSNLMIDKKGIVKYCRVGFPMEKAAQENLYSEYVSMIDSLIH